MVVTVLLHQLLELLLLVLAVEQVAQLTLVDAELLAQVVVALVLLLQVVLVIMVELTQVEAVVEEDSLATLVVVVVRV
jgi:hypothetical protein